MMRKRAVPRSMRQPVDFGERSSKEERNRLEEFRATNALPGSPEKLEVLAQRIRAGLPLWHPDDRKAPEVVLDSVADYDGD